MSLKDLNKYWQLKNRRVHAALHDISLDDSDKEDKHYMTKSNATVINFDQVKREYMKELHISENNAKSVDALFQAKPSSDKDADIYMVEFKNGKVNNREIERKARDSVLIFQSITGTQLEDTRNRVQFVLVYNEEKNPLNYRDARARLQANRGKVDFALFGLGHLRDFCFKNVNAFNQLEFEKEIVPLIGGDIKE